MLATEHQSRCCGVKRIAPARNRFQGGAVNLVTSRSSRTGVLRDGMVSSEVSPVTRHRARHLNQKADYVAFDCVADSFDRTHFIPVHVLKAAYRLVFKQLELKGEIIILDAGVGTGRMIRPLTQRKMTVIGVDISLPMLARLRQRYLARRWPMQLHIVKADVSHLPIRNSSITWVQSTHVLHLLRNWKTAVHEWKRVLVPYGSLVIFQEIGDWTSMRHRMIEPYRDNGTFEEVGGMSILS